MSDRTDGAFPVPEDAAGPPGVPRAFAMITLGCRVNQYESRAVASALLRRGWSEVPRAEADVVVVNACAVTARSSRKVRRLVAGACRERPARAVYIMGCLDDADRALLLELPQIRAVIPPAAREELLRVAAGRVEPLRLEALGRRTRAFVKAQDGCDRSCSYCIVPLMRGRSRSRPACELGTEIGDLLARGVPEVWLVGTDLGDWGGGDLPGLLASLGSAFEGRRARLRLGTLGIEALDRRLRETVAARPWICRHFHLSLQSGSPRIRRLMGRRTDPDEVRRRVDLFRQTFPDASFSADVMVGFPGETEGDFSLTEELCRAVGFVKLHIFPFSARPGTRAPGLAGAIDPAVIAARVDRLSRLERELRRAYLARLVGALVEVVVERAGPGAPDAEGWAGQYVRVRFAPHGARRGDMVGVRVVGVEGETARGEVAHHAPAEDLRAAAR